MVTAVGGSANGQPSGNNLPSPLQLALLLTCLHFRCCNAARGRRQRLTQLTHAWSHQTTHKLFLKWTCS